MALDTHSLVQSLLNKNRQSAIAASQPIVQQPAHEEQASAQIGDEPTNPEATAPASLSADEDENNNAENDSSEMENSTEQDNILYPELKARVAAAEELLQDGLLPLPTSNEVSTEQSEEAADLIHAYFELTDPEIKDHIVILLAANPAPDALNFFTTALAEDPDPYIHSQAAEVLYRRGIAAGETALKEVLDGPEDIAQLNHAITVLCKVEGTKIAPKLINIWADEYRNSDERIEALLGLEQIMGKGLESTLISFIDGIEDADYIPEDELEQVLNILSRLESSRCLPHLTALEQRLKKSVADVEDIVPLLDDIDGTISLLS